MEIKNEIKKLAPEIEAAMEKLLPHSYSEKQVSSIVGKMNYQLDLQAVNGSINAPVWDLLDRGGKRFRPALLLMVCEAFGKKSKDALSLAALVELTHNSTLIVDDIEDDSEERRGKPCLHKIYGIDIAVNAGNSIYFIPTLAITNLKVDAVMKNELYEAFLREMINVSIGQGVDIYWHRGLKQSVSEDEYLQMAAFKTGCLTRMACKLGAIFSGASKEQISALADYGESIGVGFQIQDDILNLVASEEYGKEIGGDISEGKRTLMTIHSLKHSAKAKRLSEILAMHTKDKKLIAEAIEIIRAAGSLDYAKDKAAKIVARAWEKTEGLLPVGAGKIKIKALAEYLIARKY